MAKSSVQQTWLSSSDQYPDVCVAGAAELANIINAILKLHRVGVLGRYGYARSNAQL